MAFETFETIIIELPRKRLIKPKAQCKYNDLKVNGNFTSMLLMVCKDSFNYPAEKIFRPKKNTNNGKIGYSAAKFLGTRKMCIYGLQLMRDTHSKINNSINK